MANFNLAVNNFAMWEPDPAPEMTYSWAGKEGEAKAADGDTDEVEKRPRSAGIHYDAKASSSTMQRSTLPDSEQGARSSRWPVLGIRPN